jgi:hypothetical protein
MAGSERRRDPKTSVAVAVGVVVLCSRVGGALNSVAAAPPPPPPPPLNPYPPVHGGARVGQIVSDSPDPFQNYKWNLAALGDDR